MFQSHILRHGKFKGLVLLLLGYAILQVGPWKLIAMAKSTSIFNARIVKLDSKEVSQVCTWKDLTHLLTLSNPEFSGLKNMALFNVTQGTEM